MRNAPPVQVSVGRFAYGGVLLHLLAGLELVGLGWACFSGLPVRTSLVLMLCVVACLCAALWLWRQECLPAGALSWDGQSWSFGQPETAAPVQLELVWDAGQALLLRVRGADLGPWPRYTCLAAQSAPTQWHKLRCAVYARDTL